MSWPRKLLTFELRLLRALVLVALRRVDGVAPGDVTLPYARAALPFGVLLTGLSVVELVVVELVVPWPAARAVLLVLGVWGLLVVAGLLAMEWTHPHVARPDGLLVRHGGLVSVHVPWELVVDVRRRTRAEHSTWAVDGDALHLPVGGVTVIDLVLAEPLHVRAGRQHGVVTRICVAADEPLEALDVLRCRAATRGGC